MTVELFHQSLTMLQSYFNQKIEKKEVLHLYWESLKYIDNTAWNSIIQNIINNFTPTSTTKFPLIKDFLSAGGQSGEHMARNMVGVLRKTIHKFGAYESIDFQDQALHNVVIRYGGWIELCNWTESDWKMKETAIIKSYESEKSACPGPSSNHLAGIHEQTNESRTPIKIRPISKSERAQISTGAQMLTDLASKVLKKVE